MWGSGEPLGVIAVYSRNGGAGKTTLAVNLAWASARLSQHSTLLWDLDPQANATFVMSPEGSAASRFGVALAFQVGMEQFVRHTSTPKLALLPADGSLKAAGALSVGPAGGRVRMLVQQAQRAYGRIIIDCPPGMSGLNDEVLLVADLIIVPVVPSAVSMRALTDLAAELRKSLNRDAVLMPVFTMVDRRRASHRELLAKHLDFPVIPVNDSVELMSDHKTALGAFAPRSDAARAYATLWRTIEVRLMASPAAQAQPAPLPTVQR